MVAVRAHAPAAAAKRAIVQEVSKPFISLIICESHGSFMTLDFMG